MDEKLNKLLKEINFEEKNFKYFNNAKIEKIMIHDKNKYWVIYINIDNNIPVNIYNELSNKINQRYKDIEKIIIKLNANNIDINNLKETFDYIFNNIISKENKYKVFEDREYDVMDNKIMITIYNKIEEDYIKDILLDIESKLSSYGYKNIIIDTVMKKDEKLLKMLDDEMNIKYDLPQIKEVKQESHGYKRRVARSNIDETNITFIKDINEEMEKITIKAEVFGIELFETKSGYFIFTLKVTDYTDSIYMKLFTNKEEEKDTILSSIKEGKWYLFAGHVKEDEYMANQLVFNGHIKSIEEIEVDMTINERKDEEQEKRVELHAHSMMSQMDGVCTEEDLVKTAIKFGHPGVAITDHDCTQGFVHMFTEATSYNKKLKKKADEKISELEENLRVVTESGKEEGIKEITNLLEKAKEEKKNLKYFKVAYGAELEMFDSYLNVCFNPKDMEIEGNTFVVFDTETTGFNAGLGNSMIEIGAVKICHGEVIDRFDEFINPNEHIGEHITKVTDISDDDVKDADNEEEVIKRFKEWIGDLPLVAHNAKFDKNMLDMAYYKYNLGKLENPIIDTLMLSRVINRDLKKHSLKALGKYYNINTGELEDDDEDGTNYLDSLKLDDYVMNEIDNIKVDNEDVIVKEEDNYYIPIIHKGSKTDKTHIIVTLKNGTVIDEEYNLHPAENEIEIKYSEFNNIYIKIYVGQHHGADVDSENTGYIFAKMLNQIKGINNIKDLNNLYLLEETIYQNDHNKLSNIGDLTTLKNYIRLKEENEEVEDDKYPFYKYGNKDYVWKYPWCYEDNLQMYENIPAKTYNENIASLYDYSKHVILLAKNKTGLKNLFKIVSYANTNFIVRNAKIPRRLIEENKEGILIGSSCLNGEIFNIALTRSDEDLRKAMEFYDYIEVQPISNYLHLLKRHDINNIDELKYAIKKIIDCAYKINKLIVATGDVHNINPEDLISREIIATQNVPGKGRHPLARYMSADGIVNNNLRNIKDAILESENLGNKLDSIDIKVLKYIYILNDYKDINITSNNIIDMYVKQKKENKDEKEELLKTEEGKKTTIESSIRKLETLNIITSKRIKDIVVYEINDKYYTSSILPQVSHIPNQYFRTTREMKEEFSFINDDKIINDIVVLNTNKILDMIEEIEVVDYPEKPYSPIIEHSQETCRDLVFEKATKMYGNPLPGMIEQRIANEFYGDKILDLVKYKMKLDKPDISEEEINSMFDKSIHEVIMSGYDEVVNLMKLKILEEEDISESDALEKAKLSLGGIIGGGFDVIYLIAQKLVKHSNDDGYLVGSRGSVGSSLVATMMGITECNGLPAHYYCENCSYGIFEDEDGISYGMKYNSGFDLPERICPKCGKKFVREGNDMPFATFLGFNADKVPDIDLNFSGDNQASAHEYTKVLFGTDNVYRAGTIGTVADKTAYGYVLGYFEENCHKVLKTIASTYGVDIPGKDDLKKKGIIKPKVRVPELERLAVGCTGVKRTTGQHPGGIVVVPGYKDVWDFTPFQYPADDPTSAWRTTHFDYHAIDADLLKLDILGHDDPTVLRMLQDLSGIDVTKIDLGDEDTMKIFTGPEVLGVSKDDLRGVTSKDGRKYCPTGTLGVPEFGTSFLLGMLEETKPTTFAELIKISGLSHGTDVWLGNARDLCTPDNEGNIMVPFKDVIGCRDDIMVSLIKWGMKPAKAFKIMEFVRKGKASKDPAKWEEFSKEMKEGGIPDWYIESCRKIKYMFPKAHATAYVTSAFRIAWFKVHMPIYYYAAYFSIRCNQFDPVTMVGGTNAIRRKIDELEIKMENKTASNKETDLCGVLYSCLEMTLRGMYFVNIDLDKSLETKFLVTEDNKGLIIPFCALDGLGENVAQYIVKEREISPFISVEDMQKRSHVSTTIVENMKNMGILKDMPDSNQLSLF